MYADIIRDSEPMGVIPAGTMCKTEFSAILPNEET